MWKREKSELFEELLAGTAFRLIHCDRAETTKHLLYTVRSPFTRLILQRQGLSRFEMLGRKMVLKPGHLMLVPTDVELRCDQPRGVKQYFTYCRIDYAGCVDLFELMMPRRLIVRSARGATLFRRLIHNFHTRNIAGRLASLSCFLELIRPFFDDIDVVMMTGRLAQTQRLLPAIQYIDRNIARRLSVKELAAQVHLSPKYFSNLFSSVMGTGLIAYVNHRRILLAKELLVLLPLSIKEVSARVGFDDPFYFSRLFRRIEGVSPTDYCRRAE